MITKVSEFLTGTLFVVLAMCVFFACFARACDAVASDDEITEMDVVRAVRILQPSHSPAVAASWAGVFWEASHETDIDPLLLTAIAFRESSIREGVVGDRGEIGPMQLHGVALKHRPGRCDASKIDCSVRGGAAVLQYWKAECNAEAWAIWIGAYGLGRCPSIDEARELKSVKRARRLYEKVGGTSWI